MPDWCPKCHAMLPPDLENCPSCGARLGRSGKPSVASLDSTEGTPSIGGRDIAWLSLYIIGIAAIPLLLAVVIGVICILAGS
jgi:hypothetical protein